MYRFKINELEFFNSSFIECLPNMVIISGNNGIILDCNADFVKKMGFRRREILGKNLKELFDDENKWQIHKISQNLQNDEIFRDIPVTIISKDDKKIHCRISSKTVYDDNGKSVMTVNVINEISTRICAEMLSRIVLADKTNSDDIDNEKLSEGFGGRRES